MTETAVVGHVLLTFTIYEEDGQFVATCRELGVSTCADSVDAALEAIYEATALYLTTLEEVGERERVFMECGLQVVSGDASEDAVDISVRPREVVTRRSLPLPFHLAFG